MIEVGLFDGTFTGNSMGFGEVNGVKKPKYIRWVRNEYRKTTVFTDMCLDKVADAPQGTTKIAWLIEPAGFSYTAYDKIKFEAELFDYVISHDHTFINTFVRDKGFWCPCGGAWVEWNYLTDSFQKTRGVSFITTAKDVTDGHKIRHDIFNHLVDGIWQVDKYGAGATPLPTKDLALLNHMFSIVIESVQTRGYFSEKLIDCFLTNTVPIYWGAPDIDHYFDTEGIIRVGSWDHLSTVLAYETGYKEYLSKSKVIERNFNLAKEYVCPEDWAYKHYPWLFK